MAVAKTKVRLVRGQSYTGKVEATRQKPVVEVDSKLAQELVQSGYFALVTPSPAQPPIGAQ
ncbi:MAG: hypothetical protein LBN05_01975 [Oscillospiraceae bacterium]|jgi:hypothetical protein|nr:hypothetical protein [Oscillospiraceae bacterium]